MQSDMRKLKILFLCTGNSCRSQMAEGWTRHLKSDLIEPYSAGVNVSALNPLAVAVMKEVGVDISDYRSKPVKEVMHVRFNYVITLCGQAQETCPLFPGKTRIFHQGFDDPQRLAETAASEEEVLNLYRQVRDEIRSFVEKLPGSLDVLEKRYDR